MNHSPSRRATCVCLLLFLGVLSACRPADPVSSTRQGQLQPPTASSAVPPSVFGPGPVQRLTPQRTMLNVGDPSFPTLQRPGSVPQDPLVRTPEQELLLRSARNALALGHLGEALDLFDSYLLQLPDDQEVRIEYAGLLVREGKLAGAREMYEEAIIMKSTDTGLRRSLADVFIMGGEYGLAVKQLEEVVALQPEDLDAAAMLCRTYTWLKDFERAQEVYERHLRKLDPSSEADQLLLAPVLLDMQRPREALPYLERLHRRYPRELRWATHMVLCYQLTGQGERAAKTVLAMASLEPSAIDMRIRLGDQLLSLQNYKLAMQVNEQVMRASPTDPMARLMAARILLEAYDTSRAREALEALDHELGTVRKYQLALAQLYHLTGEWVASQSVFEMMLLDNEDDHEVRIRLAMLRREKGDFQQAKAELRKVPLATPQGPRARLELGLTLIAQGRATDAVGICSALAAQRPNDVDVLLGLVRAQLEMGAITQAKATCQRFVDGHPSDNMAIGQVRVLLANAHLQEGNAVQAARIYQMALSEPTVHAPEVFYGLSLARTRGVNSAAGEMAMMSSTVVSSGEDVRLRIELGKLALGDQDYRRAIGYLSNVLRWQPNNITAMVLLGEAESLALKAGVDASPVRTFSTALARNPGNTRARLGLARAYVIRREFDLAIPEYDALVAQDAGYAFAKREYARALYWDHRYEEAFEAYDELIAGLPTEAVAVDVFGSGSPGFGARAEFDFEAELELSEAVRLELAAKINRDWRPAIATKALEQLVVLEPANQEALFDLAQLDHRRGHTSRAMHQYEELIKLSGGHREATQALAGAEREISTRVDVITGNEDRSGRDGLAVIKEAWTLSDVSFPLGDRADYAGIGIGRRSYDAGSDVVLNANVLRVFGSSEVGQSTVIDGRIEIPAYDMEGFLNERIYYDMGVRYTSDSEMAIDVRLFSEPVAENLETMRRDLNRSGARVGLSKKASQRVDYGGSMMFANYSDNNSQLEANLYAAYEFNPAPMEFRMLLKADFENFTSENTDLTDSVLADLDTPYFAPKGYSVYSLQLDWKHQFGDDWFTGSKEMYYRASGRAALDANSVGYYEFDVGAAYDFTDWFGVRLGVRLLRSSAIDMTTTNALVVVRWP
ncbi:MAG: tetratricopeptide repeat protein [Planctomycetota bacterium]|nr:tetratricopeptide repeat protein [Planctomycetota bacterium]